MTPADVLVILGGLAAIAWVNWYFLLSEAPAPAPAAPVAAGGVQRVAIEVEGGYRPATIRVRAGRPVRLDFHRTETNACTEEVVLPDFGLRRFLPAHRTTAVEFTPTEPGVHEFACGMGMVRGKIVVEPAEG